MSGGRAVAQDGPDVLLSVRVQPRASRNQVVLTAGGAAPHGRETITIRLTAPPVEGAANAACRAYLAERLGVPQSRILIVRGETARTKLLRIRSAEAATVLARLTSKV